MGFFFILSFSPLSVFCPLESLANASSPKSIVNLYYNKNFYSELHKSYYHMYAVWRERETPTGSRNCKEEGGMQHLQLALHCRAH